MTTIFSKPNSFNVEIVREGSAIARLDDGKVYVLATSSDLFVDAVKTAIKHFKNLMDKSEGLIYPYDVCAIENMETVFSTGRLYDAVQKGGNLVLPISTPNDTGKLYLVAQTDAASLDIFVPSMVMQAENLTKQAVEDALQNLATFEPESCDELFKEVFLNYSEGGVFGYIAAPAPTPVKKEETPVQPKAKEKPLVEERAKAIGEENDGVFRIHQKEELTAPKVLGIIDLFTINSNTRPKKKTKEEKKKEREEKNKQNQDVSAGGVFGTILAGKLGPIGGFAGMAMAPTRGLYGAIPDDISYQKSREIIGRFVKNMNWRKRIEKTQKITEAQEKKLQKIQSEIDYVLNLFPPNVYSRFMLFFMMKKDIAFAFDNCLNRDKMASDSKIKVSVELPIPEVEARFDPNIVNKLKTNGKFRVYLTDGVDTVQVKFSRAISCVVYIMYLLDRKQRGDDINALKISKNETLFCYLYGALYNETDAKKNFNTIVKTKSGDKISPRSRLADHYSDIRQALDEAVSVFGESALPFYIPNEYSHITVLSSNISIPETLKKVSFVY